VMTFVGEANQLGNVWVRPHELRLLHAPVAGAIEAIVERIAHYGFDARVELATGDSEPLVAQLTREQLEELEIVQGQIVWVAAAQERVFA
jgi:ABC-type sulfate/molybdate transport systems ATPase subunit